MKPALDKCVVCGKSYQKIAKEQLSGQMSGLYFSGGGLICPICLIKKKEIGEELAECGLKEISALQLLLTGNWGKIAAYDLPEKEKTAVHRLVLEYARYHSERRVWDWMFLITLHARVTTQA